MNISFFPNTADGTHCFQAALRMALSVLMPDREFTYDELDVISGKGPGMWTWPTAAMLWLMDEGLTVRLIEDFDYADFGRRGGDYLVERYGEEVARAQIARSDVEAERALARRFAEAAPIERRVPGLDDIRSELSRGAVVIVNVNAAALVGRAGYSGHFVVVCDAGRGEVLLHDPGLPPRPSLRVPGDLFEAAWAYPTPRERNILSISR